MRLVRFPIGGGYWWMRCEKHVPAYIAPWLKHPEPPGFLEVEEVSDEEAKQRCVACLAESLKSNG